MHLFLSAGRRLLPILLAVMACQITRAQKTTVLPGNGASSSIVAPQGNVKYQRQFYLVDSAEVKKSGLQNGMAINSIGFTIGVPQDSVATGIFRVYLENTSDTVSRLDTNWTVFSLADNTNWLSALNPGTYEWQVRSNCVSNSVFTPISTFEISKDTCTSPTHFVTENITSNSATLRWVKPAYAINSFKVEYSKSDTVNWISVITSGDHLEITGLVPDKTYQWRVSSLCTNDSLGQGAITFKTDVVNNCNPPSNLLVGTKTDTTVNVSWTAASGATRYDIFYRRLGTSSWNNTIALSNSVKLLYLSPGTTYEWQVRTVCGTNSYGASISGTAFSTLGTQVCYPPENKYADSVSSSSVKLTWDQAQGANSYQLRYRPKDVIYWSNAIAPMTPVHNDSLKIPDTTGVYDVNFIGGTPFTYTGKGLYIAYEYIDSNGRLSTENVSIANFETRTFKDSLGRDSANQYVSLGSISMDTLPVFLSATAYRPETRLGSSSLNDSVEVVAVYTLGYHPLPFRNPDTVYAMIRNYTNTDKTYPVTLTIKDNLAVKYTETVNATVHADSVFLVSFSGWAPAQVSTDTVIVSIPPEPNENVVNNNVNFYLQTVNNSILAYDDGNSAITSTGLDTTAGLILARYSINGCGAVNAAQIFLTSSAAGHPVYAVVTDETGTIVASSASITPDSSTVNGYHNFYFTSPVVVNSNTNFYIGLAQTDFGGGYLPVGVQWDGSIIRSGAFYRAAIDGSGLIDHPVPGRLMIRAEIIADAIAPVINGNFIICPSGNTTLTAGSITKRFASQVIDYSSQYGTNQFAATQVLGTPNVYPEYTISPNAWISNSTDGQREYLVLRFPNPDSVNFVDIYETYNPGAVDTIFVKNPDTNLFEMVYSNTATNTLDSVAKINRINFPLTNFKVSEIRIAINSPVDSGYNSIDAVAIGRMESVPDFSSYTWTKQTGSGPLIIGSGTSVNVSDSGHYTLTVTSLSGCISSTRIEVTTPSQIIPVIAASGPLEFCIGDSVILTSNKSGGNTWSTGATTNSIVVKTSGTYTVSYNDGTGCGSLISLPVAVIVNSLPVVTIDGQLGICPGGNTTLTANPSGNSYAWSTGAVTQAAVITAPTLVSVIVTDNNGCKASASITTFNVANPTPHITGTFGFCPGSSTILNAGAGFASYNWSNAQTGVSSISVNTAGMFYVTVTNNFGCTGEDSAQVIEYPNPAPFITGSLSICGGSTTLNAGGGYSSYLWSSNETTQTILVTLPGTYSVTVTDENGCNASASATTIKDSLPPRPGVISGTTNGVCNSPGTVFFIHPIPEATHYVWFTPPGATVVSGQGDTTVTIAFDNTFTSGDLIVASSNACGQSGSLIPRILPLKVVPIDPVAINGPISGVCNSMQTYSTPVISSATSYTWTVPTGATITAGQGSSTITVVFTSSFIAGNICVKANNACGSSEQKCVLVTGVSSTPDAITGPVTACFGQKNVSYTVPPVAGALSYTWTVPQQASIVSGQGSNSIVVNFGNKSGNIEVKANNSCGSSLKQMIVVVVSNCHSNRSAQGDPITVAEKLLEPEIIANDGGLDILGEMQLAWTLGEPAIESVRSKNRLYTQGFHQPLIVMNKNNDEIIVQDEIKITAAPNPVQHILMISFQSQKEENLMVNLLDMNGKILFVKPINGKAGTMEINMSPFSNGIYLIKINRIKGNYSKNFKVVKIN